MDLILWRHCEAEPGEPDLGRRLTSKGVKQAERMAAWLDSHLPDTCRILVSPADRAQQTALALQAQVQDGAGTGARRVGGEHSRRGQLARFARARADRRAPAVARRRRVVPAVGRGGVLVGAQGRGLVAVRTARRKAARRSCSRWCWGRTSPDRLAAPPTGRTAVSVRAPAPATGSPGPPTPRARRRAGATSADARRASASRRRT